MLILALLALLAVDPKLIPADRHESISRAMLKIQAARIRALELRVNSRLIDGIALNQAAWDEVDAAAEYAKLLGELRKEFGAGENCLITWDRKEWQCQTNVQH